MSEEKTATLRAFHTAFNGLFAKPEKALVLDVGAGTGRSGEILQDLGYINVDAVEPCPDFVKICTEKGVYSRVIVDVIDGEHQLDIPDDTYDAVGLCRVFAPGHLPCNALHEIIRVVKPGGYIVNCMREDYLWMADEYKDRLQKLIDQLERDGRWKKVRYEIYSNHHHSKNGITMIHQVC